MQVRGVGSRAKGFAFGAARIEKPRQHFNGSSSRMTASTTSIGQRPSRCAKQTLARAPNMAAQKRTAWKTHVMMEFGIGAMHS